MVEWQHGDKVGESEVGGKIEGVDNNGHECDDYSSSNSSLSCLEYDEDLTTDGNAVTLATVPNNESANFGNIAVKNSTDIHFGNKTFYHGPVTIKQFVYASEKDQIGVENVLPEVATVDVSGLYPKFNLHSEPRNETQLTKASIHKHQSRCDQLTLCWSRENSKSRCALCIVTLVVAALVILTTLVFVLTNKVDEGAQIKVPEKKSQKGEGTYNPPRTKYDVTLSGKLRVLTRNDWLAQPAVGEREKLHLPVPYIIISHTATENCSSQAECTYFVRTMQTFHIESKGWNDIGYNFLIGGDGYVYVGRGWDNEGAHSYGYNICSIGISFIGTFLTVHPPANQLLAAEQLIAEGVQLGKIRKDYRLVGHRQVSATESPGQALFNDIKALPHWTEKPVSCANITSELD